jgi:hypothetical protein
MRSKLSHRKTRTHIKGLNGQVFSILGVYGAPDLLALDCFFYWYTRIRPT